MLFRSTLDLAEISGQVAVPVEYRKGRPRHVALGPPADDCGEMEQSPLSNPEAWPTDRVQVGLQAVLLEDAGYIVREAVIYYAEEKLRLRITVDDTLKAEALLTLEKAKEMFFIYFCSNIVSLKIAYHIPKLYLSFVFY